MSLNPIISSIDNEIQRLTQARELLLRAGLTEVGNGRRGAGWAKAGGARHVLSPEGRARIVEAQKRRWAALKKSQN